MPSLKIPFREKTSVVESLQILGMASVALSVGLIIYTAVGDGSRPSFLEPDGRRLMFLEYSLQALSLFLLAWLGPPRGLGRLFCLIGLSLALPLVIGAEIYHPIVTLLIWSLLAQLAVGTDADWLRRPHPLGTGSAAAFMVVDEDPPSHVAFNRLVFVLLALVAAAAVFYNYGSLSRELTRSGRGSPGGLEMAVMLLPLSLWPAFMAFALAAIGRRRAVFIGLGCLAALTFLAADLWSEYVLSGLDRAKPARLEYSITLQLAATRLLAWIALALALILLLARKLSLIRDGSVKPVRVWPRAAAAVPLAALALAGLLYWGEIHSHDRVAPRALTEPLTTVRLGELEFQLPARMNQYNWNIYIHRPGGRVKMTETAYADGLTPDQGLAEAVDSALRSRLAQEIEIGRTPALPMRLVASRGYDSTRPNPGMTTNFLVLTLLLPQTTGYVKLTQTIAYDPLALAMDDDLRNFIRRHGDDLAEWADQYFVGYRWLGEPDPDGAQPAPGRESGFKTRLGLFSSHPEGLGIRAEFGRKWHSRLEISLHLPPWAGRLNRSLYPYEEIINYYQGRVVDYRTRIVGGEIQAAEVISYPLPPTHRRLSGWTEMTLATTSQAPVPLYISLRPAGRIRGDRDRPYLLGAWSKVLDSIKVVPQGLPLGEGPRLEQLKAEEEAARAAAEEEAAKARDAAKATGKSKAPAKTKKSRK